MLEIGSPETSLLSCSKKYPNMNICTEKQSKFSEINSKGRVRTAVAKQIYKLKLRVNVYFFPPHPFIFSFLFSWGFWITFLLKQSQARQLQKWCLLIFYVLYKCWNACPENRRWFFGGDLTSRLCLGDCPNHHAVCWDMQCSSTTVWKQSQTSRAGVRVQRECDVYFF